MALADKIRKLRLERGWTQEDLASRSGLSRPYISDLERNKNRNPTAPKLLKLAHAFNIHLEELYQAAGYIKEAKPLSPRPETPEDILDRYRIAMPASIPVYEELTLHAGSPVQAIDYIPTTREQARGRRLEAYIVRGNCLTPQIEDTDTVIIDRDGQIDNGDIVACLISGELHLARLRKIASDTYLENNHGRWKLEEAAIAAPVIEVRRRLK